MKAVITIVGQDRVGIIAKVSTILAEKKANILNINQNIVEGFFNMVMIVDVTEMVGSLVELRDILAAEGKAMSLDIRTQHEDIFKSMHTI